MFNKAFITHFVNNAVLLAFYLDAKAYAKKTHDSALIYPLHSSEIKSDDSCILLVFKSKQNLEATRKGYFYFYFNGKIGRFTQFLALELISEL